MPFGYARHSKWIVEHSKHEALTNVAVMYAGALSTTLASVFQ